MKVERGNSLKPAFGIQIPRNRQRREFPGFRIARRTQAEAILDRHFKSFHECSRIFTEPLLAGHQSVAVVVVLQIAHFQVI
jgi:hypothetical protein